MIRPLLLLLACATAPLTAQDAAPRQLHPGAVVRVKVPQIQPDWLDGTVVRGQTSPTCLAVRLEHADTAGRRQYVFLAGVTALLVDRRTNEGVLTLGLPPAEDGDWEEWPPAEIARLVASCRRARSGP